MVNLYTNAAASLLENAMEGGSCIELGSTNDVLQVDCNTPGLERDYDNAEEEEENDDVLYDTSKRPKRKRHRGPRLWKEKWQELYPWASLRKVNGEDRMFCTLCEAHGSTSTRNAFRVEGSCNFQPSALSTHENSCAHKNACLSHKGWTETHNIEMITKNSGLESGTPGMLLPVSDSVAIANQLSCMANMLEAVVTREDFHHLRADLHLMQRSEDARRINAFCAPTDPLVPVPTLDGSIPDNLPGSLAEMMLLPSDHIEALLMEYKLPIHGTQEAKLRRLKAHLGFRG